MNNTDTIIALSTPNGLGAISVIRISGPDSISTTENLFVAKGNKKLSQMKSHTCCGIYTMLRDLLDK